MQMIEKKNILVSKMLYMFHFKVFSVERVNDKKMLRRRQVVFGVNVIVLFV